MSQPHRALNVSPSVEPCTMPMMPAWTIIDASDYLERDVLRNIVLSKMITAFPDATRAHRTSSHLGLGVMVRLAAKTFDSDRQTCPSAQRIAVISSHGEGVTREVLEFAPRDLKIVFKLNRPRGASMIQSQFNVERTQAFLSFNIRTSSTLALDPDVHTTQTVLAALQTRGLTRRNQVHEANTAPIRPAESLGLEHFLTIEH